MNDTTYASPFSWRYGRTELRELFSERERRTLWRAVWIALAESQMKPAASSRKPSSTICVRTWQRHRPRRSARRSNDEIGHDLMAEIRVYASQATIGGGKIHLGATSMDIEDTVETFRMRKAALTAAGRIAGYGCSACVRAGKSSGTPIWSAWATRICSRPSRRRSATGSQPLRAGSCSSIGPRLEFARHAVDRQGRARRRWNVGLVHAFARRHRRAQRRQDQENDVLGNVRAWKRATSQRKPTRASSTILLLSQSCWPRCVAFEVRRRRAHPKFAPGFGEMFEPFGSKASRQFGNAVQTQPGDVGTHWFAFTLAARVMLMWRGRTPRRIFSNGRSTTARIAAPSCPKRSCVRTKFFRLRAKSSTVCVSTNGEFAENLRVVRALLRERKPS